MYWWYHCVTRQLACVLGFHKFELGLHYNHDSLVKSTFFSIADSNGIGQRWPNDQYYFKSWVVWSRRSAFEPFTCLIAIWHVGWKGMPNIMYMSGANTYIMIRFEEPYDVHYDGILLCINRASCNSDELKYWSPCYGQIAESNIHRGKDTRWTIYSIRFCPGCGASVRMRSKPLLYRLEVFGPVTRD